MIVTARQKKSEKKEWGKKRGIVGEGELISLHHGPTADKEILFWGENRAQTTKRV